MDATLQTAYNAQITMEYGSAYHYLAMGAWLEAEGFPGMARWMRLQADEENTH